MHHDPAERQHYGWLESMKSQQLAQISGLTTALLL